VAAADEAIADGSVDELAGKIGRAAEQAVRERFQSVIEAKKHKDESVEDSREYVEAYVEFVHYVEALHTAVARGRVLTRVRRTGKQKASILIEGATGKTESRCRPIHRQLAAKASVLPEQSAKQRKVHTAADTTRSFAGNFCRAAS
jgi:hypothetical protein